MAQITLYLDEETSEKMRKAAEAEGLSQSRWVARLIEQRVRDDWPGEVRELAGAWADFPSPEDLRAQEHEDASRESM